jgi:hypothetical protein
MSYTPDRTGPKSRIQAEYPVTALYIVSRVNVAGASGCIGDETAQKILSALNAAGFAVLHARCTDNG